MKRHLIPTPPINALDDVHLSPIRPIRTAVPICRPDATSGRDVFEVEDRQGGKGEEAV